MEKKLDTKTLLARAEDTAKICEKQYSARAFGFLTPAEAAVIKKGLNPKCVGDDINFKFFGGYPEAERCLFLTYPQYAAETIDSDFISLLEIKGRNIKTLSHRDFLGSIMGLGIKREKIGDILCLEDKCLVFVVSDIADYIISNLDMVARCGVKAAKQDIGTVVIPKRKFEEIKTTVASLRLDSVIGAALKTSRANAVEVIKQKKVSVNWQESIEPSSKVNPGDVFSVRGVGRFRLAQEINLTRKERLGICIEKAL
jgi:RNA-binding protein YlmH